MSLAPATPRLCRLLAAVGTAVSLVSASGQAPKPLWQIGQVDRSSAEFAPVGDYRAFEQRLGRAPVTFEVGRSQPARDWPSFQPGPEDDWAGDRSHPFAILFSLDRPPEGTFTLRVDFADVHAARRAAFIVNANGRRFSFRLQPGHSETPAGATLPPSARPQGIELALPAALFRQGANEFALASAGSWVLYDAVTLLNETQATPQPLAVRNFAVEATPFFIRREGKVRRALEARLSVNTPLPEVSLRVQAGGETTEETVADPIWFAGLSREAGGPASRPGSREGQVFRLSREAGVADLEVAAPDSPEPFDALVTARAAGGSRSATLKVAPQRKWKIFVAASSHTDVGFTDLQARCAERHNQNTDLALDLIDRFPDFKWNLEVAWQAEIYLAARPAGQLARFARAAQAGQLGIEALYDNVLTGLCSDEAACRLTAFAHGLSRRFQAPCQTATSSDVPSQEASLPMLLAGAGIRYFSSGINNERAYPATALPALGPFWWEGPDGSRVLTIFSSQYGQAERCLLTHSLDAARPRLRALLESYASRADYPFDAIWLHGAYIDNGLLSRDLPETVRAWNERYESPRIILCRNEGFFGYIERRFGDKLPVVRGSGGCFWEDGAASSARETALCRNAQETLTRAETLLALTQPLQPAGAAYPASALAGAWRNCLLYDEHIWGAYCSISDPDSDLSKQIWKTKAQSALDAHAQADSLLAQAAARVAGAVRAESPSLLVINAAGWPRTDVVLARLPPGTRILGPSAPRPGEASGPEPSVSACETPEGTLLLVKDVPACGYGVLRLGTGPGGSAAAAPPAAQPLPVEGGAIESAFYRVTFDPASGAITSLFDKHLGRELVDPRAPYRLNEYLYVSGGEGSSIVMDEKGPAPELRISTPAKAVLRRLRLGSLGERMIVESAAAQTPRLVSEVTVWNDIRRVDIANRLTKTATRKKEAAYFAFPFAAARPVFRYECPAGIVNAGKDMLPGACLEWFAVQHFVELEDADAAIVWTAPDSPLVCLEDINRGRWPRRLALHNGHLYGYVMNNYWYTNYRAEQGGDLLFRFSITSRATADNAASARFGREAANPLLVVPARGDSTAPLPPSEGSLVEVLEPNVLLLAAKQADAGAGLVLRLWEASGQATTAHLRLNHLPAREAVACNLAEDLLQPLPLTGNTVGVPLRPSGLGTVLVK